METTAIARSMRGSIGMLAMDWLLASSTTITAAERGMPPGNAGYAIGRLGVLGDCPIDNVVGAAFFWEPQTMHAAAAEGRRVMAPMEGAAIYREICEAWGERVLDGFAGSERLGELCERVVGEASPLGAPTFVGWRDQPLPAAGNGRTFQLCQTMRELRFGRHTIAVQASGMSPLESILAGPAGEWNAEFFGWPKPYPDVADLGDRRNEIEDITDKLHAPDFEVLSPDERAELRVLAKEARAHAKAKEAS